MRINMTSIHSHSNRPLAGIQAAQDQYEQLSSNDFLRWVHENHRKLDQQSLLFVTKQLMISPEKDTPFYQALVTEVFSCPSSLDRGLSWDHSELKELLDISLGQNKKTRMATAQFFLNPKIMAKFQALPLKDRQPLLFLAQLAMKEAFLTHVTELDISPLVSREDIHALCKDQNATNLEICYTFRQLAYFVEQKKLDKRICEPFWDHSILVRISKGSCFDSKVSYLRSIVTFPSAKRALGYFTTQACIAEYQSQLDMKKTVDILNYLKDSGVRKKVIKNVLNPATLKRLIYSPLSQGTKIHLIGVMASVSMENQIKELLHVGPLGSFQGYTGPRNRALFLKTLGEYPALAKLFSKHWLDKIRSDHEALGNPVIPMPREPGLVQRAAGSATDQPLLVPVPQPEANDQRYLTIRDLVGGNRPAWADMFDSGDEL